MAERHLNGSSDLPTGFVAENYRGNDARCVLHIVRDSNFSSECSASGNIVSLSRLATRAPVTWKQYALRVCPCRDNLLTCEDGSIINGRREVAQVMSHAG